MSILIDGTGNDTTLNGVSVTTDAESSAALALKAPLVSPALTGTPTAPTQTAGDNSTKLATTAYVDGKMVRGVAVNSTSGTAIDFTGIPSWVKKISVMLNGVSVSGTSPLIIRAGTSSGVVTTGYSSVSGYIATANNTTRGISSTSGFQMSYDNASTYLSSGAFTLLNINSNIWVGSGNMTVDSTYSVASVASSITLSGVLDRVRITTVNGTDTFDAGSINVMYEG